MSYAGALMLIGFFAFAALMAVRLLPTILALPLMAAWIALVAQLPLVVYLDDVLLAGSMKLGSAMAVVIFGAMFARVVMKTGISGTIIKKAAELAGDRPRSLALAMTAATTFVFLGMSGLGAVIMVGSIAIPILMSAGISPLVSCVLVLFGLQTGLLANAANYGTYIGIFGGEVTASYYLPAFCISALVTVIFIYRNVRPAAHDGGGTSFLGLLWGLVLAIPILLREMVTSLRPQSDREDGVRQSELLRRRRSVPAAALLAPAIPLLTVFVFKYTLGFGKSSAGMVDPVAAAVAGFLLASLYAVVLTGPSQLVRVFSGSIIEGLRDIAGVLFLFMGIGMLVAVVMNQAVSAILMPLLTTIIPESPWALLAFFGLAAPAALYRGPLNMFGMGAGIAVLLVSLELVPPVVLAGAFLGVQYIQAASDPTNSHNTWIGGFANVDTALILKKTLPYTWAMCILMLCYVAVVRS